MGRNARLALGRLLLGTILAGPPLVQAANAHPHVFARIKVGIIVTDGAITGIRHTWTFDEMFSTFSISGLGDGKGAPTREQLAPLARRYVESLKSYGYFTRATIDGRDTPLADPSSYALDMRDEALELQFTLPVIEPAPAETVTLSIYDPSYYVALSPADSDAAGLEGAAPNCRLSVKNTEQPKAVDESFFRSLSANEDWAAQFATIIAMQCAKP
ncbi:MAG: DUF1007 family protein [Pseudorhodoplanes sp.]|uniref:DUF1007 family protein n=1 Tax=Pseudorhodoplanes sp. TaxID=1934341 RepID=UPI003D14D49F